MVPNKFFEMKAQWRGAELGPKFATREIGAGSGAQERRVFITESGSTAMSKTGSEQEMAEAILSYLKEHPEASDTLEGIAEWWIMRQRVRVEVDTLKRVLCQLTEGGLLEELGEKENPQYRLKAWRN